MASQLRVTDGKREWLATVDGTAVTIEGVDGVFRVTARPDGRWTITPSDLENDGGRTSRSATSASAAQTPDGVWITVEGAAGLWQARPASSRARHAAVDDDVRAPMSATVVRVLVAAGDRVAEGDILVVVEAMKMEMPLRASRAAGVRAVHCREGELVQPTSVLVELE